MSSPGSPDFRRSRNAPSELERAALEWIARHDRGLSADDERRFERWLAADPRHAALFTEFEGTWGLLDRIREFPPAGPVSPVREYTPAPPSAGANTIPPAETEDTRAGSVGARPTLRTLRRARPAPYRLTFAALTAAALVAFAVLDWTPPATRDRTASPFVSTAGAGLGEQRTINLPDGSVIRLNTETSVDIHFTAETRSIRLPAGEAHFTVAKDPRRPFTVSAAGVAVRAVGTAFNVRVRTQAVDVLVTAGRVRVRDEPPLTDPTARPAPGDAERASPAPSGTVTASPARRSPDRSLSAGEALSIPRQSPALAAEAPRPVIMTPVEIERTLAWQEKRLEFVSAALATMVEEFNRYNRVKLVIADAALAAQRFGGNFRADDPDGFVRVLELNFGVVAEQRAGETILRPAP